jgi:hypothetical protein
MTTVQSIMLRLLALLVLTCNHHASALLSSANNLKSKYLTSHRQSMSFLAAARTTSPNNKEAEEALAASILTSLRKRSKPGPTRLLDLQIDFFDPSTGLHSEGVWHNCMVGIASLHLQARGCLTDPTNDDDDAPKRIADSLWDYSWDGVSFKRRSYSGLWDHSPLWNDSAVIEQPNYYHENIEHRCVQHGMALVFWSLLGLRGEGNLDAIRYQEQHDLIFKSFVEQFWDKDVGRWHTVSKVQGWGSLRRQSASFGNPAMGVSETDASLYYYRAVDQAVGILACMGALRVFENRQGQEATRTCEQLRDIVQQSCNDLLSSDGFGYSDEESARSYIGLNRNRNFWHDGWPLLALICARRYAWRDDPKFGEEELRQLFQKIVDRYGQFGTCDDFDGTVWHWPRAFKPDTASGNVRYCGDNALLYAIARNLNWAPAPGLESCESAFYKFIKELRSRDDDGLSSVADVYRQVRLHPNTELAALVLWGEADFRRCMP